MRTKAGTEAPMESDTTGSPLHPSEERTTSQQDCAGNAAHLGSRAESARTVFNYWKAVTKQPRSHPDAKRISLIQSRLKDGYTEDDLKLAALGCASSRWHQLGENDRHTVYNSIGLIYRDGDHVDKFMRLGEQEMFRRERAVQSEREDAERRIAKSTVGDKYLAARGQLLSIVGKG